MGQFGFSYNTMVDFSIEIIPRRERRVNETEEFCGPVWVSQTCMMGDFLLQGMPWLCPSHSFVMRFKMVKNYEVLT